MTSDPISMLLVSSRTPPPRLVDLLRQNALVTRASGRQEALSVLARNTRIQVVVTDEGLMDGDWRGVLSDALRANSQMQVVIYTGPLPAMELYREARALGALSLLVDPYDRYQIECLLQNARSAAVTGPTPAGKSPQTSSGALFHSGTPLLLVTAGRECDGLVRCFESHGLHVRRAWDRAQAQDLLGSGDAFEFVITAELLPDGTWKDIANDVREASTGSQVFLASDSEKGPVLVLETISQGVVLVRLQDRKQVQWLIELAVARHRWRGCRPASCRPAPFEAAVGS